MTRVDVVFPGRGTPPLTYEAPEPLPAGSLVLAQLRDEPRIGVVWETDVPAPPPNIEIKPAWPLGLALPSSLMDLARWITRYYLAEPWQALAVMVPPALSRWQDYRVQRPGSGRSHRLEQALKTSSLPQVFEELRQGEVLLRPPEPRPPEVERLPATLPVTPTPDQERALRAVLPFLEPPRFRPFLLYGVTGSGKTMVYLWLAQRALNEERSALVLVPEIALTPQLMGQFYALMGNRVLPYHSRMRPRERLFVWWEVQKGPRVVVGPRSALFLPLYRLGLIVVDEEHDTSYKSSEAPRYHARDVAVMRGRQEGVPVVLGSASPSLESVHNALRKRYTLLTLRRRVRGYWFPRISVVDLREEESLGIVSLPLMEHLARTVREGKQAILYLNRRGYAPVLICRRCGYIPRCPQCDVALTYHRDENLLRCHLCDHREALPDTCPRCGAPGMKPLRFGTQRVVRQIQTALPRARIERLDLDRVRRRHVLEQIYREMREGRIQVLVGTQMVSQGLDFPQVDLVGVLDADHDLGFPDFRAEERAYQRFLQVAGRARRGGVVVIQTHTPEAPPIRALASGNTWDFLKGELERRRALGYPPFRRLIRIEFAARDAEAAQAFAETWKQALAGAHNDLEVLGPSPCPRRRMAGLYRFHLLLKFPRPYIGQEAVRAVQAQYPPPSSVRVKVDVDPVDLL